MTKNPLTGVIELERAEAADPGRAREIRGLCQRAKLDAEADRYIMSDMTVEQVKDDLISILAEARGLNENARKGRGSFPHEGH